MSASATIVAAQPTTALTEVVRTIENFDPSLVRSAVPNYILAEFTARHVKVVLTGDPMALRRLVSNLLENAVKFTEQFFVVHRIPIGSRIGHVLGISRGVYAGRTVKRIHAKPRIIGNSDIPHRRGCRRLNNRILGNC